jgi:hypothetical protein
MRNRLANRDSYFPSVDLASLYIAHYNTVIHTHVGNVIANQQMEGRISNDGGPQTASGQISDFGPVSLKASGGGVRATGQMTRATKRDSWLGL